MTKFNGVSAIIGYTGFVGGNIFSQHNFDFFYDSKNIEEIKGKNFDLIVCAGAPGVKWLANKNSEQDKANIQRLINSLSMVNAKKFILISTIDVYSKVDGVDEDSIIQKDILDPYGKNRRILEEFVMNNFDYTIVRLPGIFGKGLKKNIIFDFLHNIHTPVHKESVFQFYNLNNIWKDISIALEQNINVLNLATEPITMAELEKEIFGFDFFPQIFTNNIPYYDMQTKHGCFWGSDNKYLYSKKDVLQDLKLFTQKLKISIITPTFNRGQFLEENILSIKNQDYPNIEHIIIDGGSTDNTIEIIKKYEGIYNLKWISEKDDGYADALNKGFKMATGDIVCWLDSDDKYLPGTIKKIVKIFESKKNVDVIFGNMFICNEYGKIFDYCKQTKFDIDTLIYWGMVLNPQTTFWRKGVLEKIGEMDKSYKRLADYDFFIRMVKSNVNFFHFNDFLSIYRHHKGQLQRSIDICFKENKIILEKYSDIKINGINLKIKKGKIAINRAINYILQGDLLYVIRSILKRL